MNNEVHTVDEIDLVDGIDGMDDIYILLTKKKCFLKHMKHLPIDYILAYMHKEINKFQKLEVIQTTFSSNNNVIKQK